MLVPEAAALLYRELTKIAAHASWSHREQVTALATLQERLFFELTRQEQLAFSTLFARISYAGHLYNMQSATLRLVHGFRRTAARVRDGIAATEQDMLLGISAIAETVLLTSQVAIPSEVLEYLGRRDHSAQPGASAELWEYKSRARVVAVQDFPDDNYLLAIDEEDPAQPVKVRYGLPDRNENFNPTIQIIRKVFGFPVTLNLLEVDIDRLGFYRPRIFVVEPDYLMDVSAISECFKEYGAEPYYYLAKKFLPYETTEPILLGNIANFFLDRLLTEPDASWQTLFRESFRMFPFAYAPMNDKAVRELSGKAQKHYINLKAMASGGLAQQGIEPENSILEPTFFSEQYGIQGRLDLFYKTDEKAAIVELKSGTPFKPNSYGIQRSHFTQTLLYDLLVRSVFGKQTDPVKYILYSGADMQHLRFAPTVAPEQWEALQLRNQLIALERLLGTIRPGDVQVPVFAKLRAAAAEGKGFLQRDFSRFETVYSNLSTLERKYFNAYSGFIAREQWLAKVGQENQENLNGHAALWRSSFVDKQQAFSILSHLEIVENRADQPDPCIIFRKTEHTNPLANFRVGDLAALYPAADADETVLDHQVIKCIITELGKETITVQLRYRQFNLKPFDTDDLWRLEPDLLEMGFASMYRSLFEWAEAPAGIRSRLLFPAPLPRPNTAETDSAAPDDPDNGPTVLEKITQSKHFFLLWGPPGTGKTSVMLRDLSAWVLNETDDNLLLLAYTNRAVDEICEALESLGAGIKDQYLRIGARFSTAERFRDQLLSQKIIGVETRAELLQILQSRRIFVSTVASFSQNDSLLKIKKFQRLVVDEASQLLEPQVVGLLSRFEHFVLIGDHRQLPAITVQPAEITTVDDPDLLGIGLSDLRDSYFERLYRLCAAQGMHAHYARLNRQGRMHEDIMLFPNAYFYNGYLKTLPNADAETDPQRSVLKYDLPGIHPEFERIFAENRVVFLPTAPERFVPGQKTSLAEAALAAELTVFFKKLFEHNGLPWIPEKTLGIISPWRAQIAQMRECLSAAGQSPDEITIDTVERYQGGARDIIIISCCVHTAAQLGSLVNISGEGVDRKLNVALTRARKHVIVLGNPEILQQDAHYRAFIEAYGRPTQTTL